MTVQITWVGVDICQAHLDIHILLSNESFQYPNNISGIKKLIEKLTEFSDVRVVFESTGGLERLLVSSLDAAEISMAMVNPRKVRAFATALGSAKTDALDAHVIALFAQSLKPEPLVVSNHDSQVFSDLVKRRRQLVSMKVAEQNRLSRAPQAVKADIEEHIAQLTERIEALSLAINEQARQQKDWKRKHKILLSFPGVGEVTAALCLAELPELGQLNEKAMVSDRPLAIARLVGVAPLNHDSGKHQGKRMIQGGRAHVRSGLYMAALVASQKNPIIREFYERLLKRGKLPKVALTACIRKTLIILNAMIRDKQLWKATWEAAS